MGSFVEVTNIVKEEFDQLYGARKGVKNTTKHIRKGYYFSFLSMILLGAL